MKSGISEVNSFVIISVNFTEHIYTDSPLFNFPENILVVQKHKNGLFLNYISFIYEYIQ